MRLVFLPRTRPDLQWFQRYYASVFPEGASQARAHYLTARRILTENPFVGRVIEETAYRELSIARTPFTFIYRIEGERIQILRVWDTRADPSNKFT